MGLWSLGLHRLCVHKGLKLRFKLSWTLESPDLALVLCMQSMMGW